MKIVMPTEQLPNKKLLGVTYGWPGVGKTTAAFTLEKPFLIDFDNGASRADATKRCPIVVVNNYGDFRRALNDGQIEDMVKEHDLRTAILDTGGTLLDNYINPWLIENNEKLGTSTGGLTMSGWGALAVEFNALVEKLKRIGLDVHIVCHAKEGDDDKIRPQMKGGSLDIIYQSADFIGYMHYEGQHRIISYKPSGTYIAKSVGDLGKVEVPSTDDDKYINVLKNISDKVKAQMSRKSNKAVEIEKQIDDLLATIEATTDINEVIEIVSAQDGFVRSRLINETLDKVKEHLSEMVKKPSAKAWNTATEFIQTLPESYKPALRKWLSVALKEAGWSYDKETSKFVKDAVEAKSE